MSLAATEKELAGKAARFLKAEMKRAGVTYAELARRLEARTGGNGSVDHQQAG